MKHFDCLIVAVLGRRKDKMGDGRYNEYDVGPDRLRLCYFSDRPFCALLQSPTRPCLFQREPACSGLERIYCISSEVSPPRHEPQKFEIFNVFSIPTESTRTRQEDCFLVRLTPAYTTSWNENLGMCPFIERILRPRLLSRSSIGLSLPVFHYSSPSAERRTSTNIFLGIVLNKIVAAGACTQIGLHTHISPK